MKRSLGLSAALTVESQPTHSRSHNNQPRQSRKEHHP
nr:MAG TPA: hypothetical protein [Caudoviricetes sp.]